MRSTARAILLALTLLAFASAALAADGGEQAPAGTGGDAKSLPGYYQFYEKTGELVRIPAEVKRDDRIEEGRLRIRRFEAPLIEMELPDARGDMVDLRGYVGEKNLLITPFRTWW